MFVVVKPDPSITNTQYAIWEIIVTSDYRKLSDECVKDTGISIKFLFNLSENNDLFILGVFKQVSKTLKKHTAAASLSALAIPKCQ